MLTWFIVVDKFGFRRRILKKYIPDPSTKQSPMGFPELRGGIFFCGSLSQVRGCCYLQLCSTPRWVHLSFHRPDHRPHPGACFTPCQAFLMFALMACGSTLLSTFRYIQVSPRFKSWQQLLQLYCQLKLPACDLIFTFPRLAQMANYALGRKRR